MLFLDLHHLFNDGTSMNIQILTKKDGGQELRLTYNDEKYKKDTAEKVLALFCKNTEKIIADMTENRG